LIEETQVHRIDVLIDGGEKPAYTIDGLHNVPDLFRWPDTTFAIGKLFRTMDTDQRFRMPGPQ
jgi:hypothetical protein